MKEICEKILRNVFGNSCVLLSCSIITEGFKNTTYKIICSKCPSPLFLKIEKPFKIPRTQMFQVKKEVAGIALCNKIGIPVPKIIMSDEEGEIFGVPWIMENFIDEKLINEYQLSEANKKILGLEYEDIYSKISMITNDFYGDTFSNGLIGQHASWINAVSKIAQLLYEDGVEIGAFGDKSLVVDLAIKKALSQIESNLKPIFFHCDLFSANIMGIKKTKRFT